MPRWIQFGFILFLASLLLACARMPREIAEVDVTARLSKPSPGKSLVFFVRTAKFGGMAPSPLFDGEKYIGTIAMEFDAKGEDGVKKKNYLAYQTEPGKHVFMTYSEIGDFLPAELLPDKTYFIQVRPVMGAMGTRFYLTPQNGQLSQTEIDRVVALGGQIKVTEAWKQWARENADKIQNFRTEWWQKWQARPASDRQELRKESGR